METERIIIYYLINRKANLFAKTRKSNECVKFGSQFEIDGNEWRRKKKKMPDPKNFSSLLCTLYMYVYIYIQ